jgi:hypothetical protein
MANNARGSDAVIHKQSTAFHVRKGMPAIRKLRGIGLVSKATDKVLTRNSRIVRGAWVGKEGRLGRVGFKLTGGIRCGPVAVASNAAQRSVLAAQISGPTPCGARQHRPVLASIS